MSRFIDDAKPYICHKRVHALKITRVEASIDAHHEINAYRIEFETGAFMMANTIWYEKHHPQTGGYYVIYDKGTSREYTSYSPAEQFESGYKWEYKPVPEFFPLDMSELHVLAECEEAMRALEAHHYSQEAVADSQHDPAEGVDLAPQMAYSAKRAKLFERLADQAKEAAERAAGITPWAPMTEEQKQGWLTGMNLRKVYDGFVAAVAAGKHPQPVSSVEAFATLLVHNEPLEQRFNGFGVVEVKARRSITIHVKATKEGTPDEVVIEDGFGTVPWNMVIS